MIGFALESGDKGTPSLQRRRAAIGLNLVALVSIGLFSINFVSGENAGRARNSLIAEIGSADDFDWSPAKVPGDFRVEQSAIPAQFNDAVSGLWEADGESLSALEKARLLARHLVKNRDSQKSIQRDSVSAYHRIVEDGDGYCAAVQP